MAEPATTSQATAARKANEPDPLLGRVINDRFKILSLIAKGGMGRVYRAEQAPLGRICALKVLHPNYQGENDPEFHKRFFLEASTASKLRHPNTVTIFDYGQTDDGVYFMAMELLEGRTLHRLIREQSPVDGLRAIHILLQIARSLREAHSFGVIHRDLKPANIVLIHEDEDPDYVKVLDFGLVKSIDEANLGENLTQTGLFMGSPKYMAPEQIRGEKVSAATDVYALGVMLYEMLTGKVPFDRPNSVNVLMAHVSEPVPLMAEMNPSAFIAPAMEELVYRCLAKPSDQRFASMDDFIAALKRVGTSLGAPVTGATVTGEYAGGAAPPSIHAPSEHSGGTLRDPTPSNSRVGAVAPTSVRPPAGMSIPPALPSASVEFAPIPFDLEPEPVPTPPRSSLPMVAGIGALAFIAVAAVGLIVHLRTAPTPQPTVTLPAPLHLPTPAQHVTVALDSTPPGAAVLENGVQLGRTPMREEWTGERGDPARTHTFVLHLEGYADATVSLHGAILAGSTVLQALPTPAVTPTPVPQTHPQGAPVRRPRQPSHGATPDGYRTDPYGDDTR